MGETVRVLTAHVQERLVSKRRGGLVSTLGKRRHGDHSGEHSTACAQLWPMNVKPQQGMC